MSAARIVVLFHENERDPTRYIVHHLAEFWREDGHHVDYVFGPRRFVAADLVFVHVDLSVVPDRYMEFATRYPRAVNGRLRDIRKSTVSDQLVGTGDDWTGPVIVKSDLNYGGLPERALEVSALERRVPVLLRLRRRLDARLRPHRIPLGHLDYEIFDSIADVPSWVWNDPRVVVERFVPEIENGLHHLRMMLVLGDRWRCTLVRSDHRVIKARRSLASEDVEPHPETFAWRERFGVDYGKIDYVVYEGRPILLDINKTIGATRSGYREPETLVANRRHLAAGIAAYLD